MTWLTGGGHICGSMPTPAAFRRPSSSRCSRLICVDMDHRELLNGPIKHIVILETFVNEQKSEEFPKIGIIRLVVKTQITNILNMACEFLRQVIAKVIDEGCNFFSLMSSLLPSSVAAFRPCQGREPPAKKINIYSSDSRSSHRDCSRSYLVTIYCRWFHTYLLLDDD